MKSTTLFLLQVAVSLLTAWIGIDRNISNFKGFEQHNLISIIGNSIIFFIPIFTIKKWPGSTSSYLLLLGFIFWISAFNGNYFPGFPLLLAGSLSFIYALLTKFPPQVQS